MIRVMQSQGKSLTAKGNELIFAGPLSQRRLSQGEEDGLTDYSLDAFEAPPELPQAQQQLEQQPGHELANQLEPPHLQRESGDNQHVSHALPGTRAPLPPPQPQHDGTPPPATTPQGLWIVGL